MYDNISVILTVPLSCVYDAALVSHINVLMIGTFHTRAVVRLVCGISVDQWLFLLNLNNGIILLKFISRLAV